MLRPLSSLPCALWHFSHCLHACLRSRCGFTPRWSSLWLLPPPRAEMPYRCSVCRVPIIGWQEWRCLGLQIRESISYYPQLRYYLFYIQTPSDPNLLLLAANCWVARCGRCQEAHENEDPLDGCYFPALGAAAAIGTQEDLWNPLDGCYFPHPRTQ